MDITQTFYDNMASQHDKIFLDWNATTHEQAAILDRIFRNNGFDRSSSVLDCACGIGTQSIGLTALGYDMTASDISDGELLQASKFECEYRATRRAEITDLLVASGCSEVNWLFPEETDFYQPIVVAKK